MRSLRRAWRRLIANVSRRRDESEMAAEIESHLQMQAEDYMRAGISRVEAERQARVKFGGIESVKENYRDERRFHFLEALLQDLRYAGRMIRKAPGFTAVAVLSLSVGIGAAVVIFSVVNGTLLRPLPYAEPDRLASILVDGAISGPMYLKFREEARSLEKAALFVNWSANLSGTGEPVRIPGARVSAGLFDLLGVSPRMGRTFTTQEDQKGTDRVIIISDKIWRSQFASDPAVIGRFATVDGAMRQIIGVMPAGFQFPDGPELPAWAGAYPPAEIWRPMALEDWERTSIGSMNFGMVGRLRPGVTSEQAAAEMDGLLRKLAPERRPTADKGLVTVRTLEDAVTGQVRRPVLILFGAVAVALLIACVNVANLLLARGVRRRSEFAVRVALGAARSRIVLQLMTEALLLALWAAGLAIPFAMVGLRALLIVMPGEFPRVGNITLDFRVLAFAVGLAFLTTLVFGVVPALQTAPKAPAVQLQGRTVISASAGLRKAMVVAELALSLVLLTGAALLGASFLTVARIPLGFHPENVLTAQVSFPNTRFDAARRVAAIERLTSRCRELPGVSTAAAVSTLPLTGESEGWGIVPADNPQNYAMVRVRAVTPSYFRVLGIRFKAGRDFTADDRKENPVAIISETAARRFWPGVSNPIGRKLATGKGITIVGIVEDTRASGLDTEVRPYLYVPFSFFAPEEFALVLRSPVNVGALGRAIKSEVWGIDKDQPVTHIAAMEELVSDSIAPRRFQSLVMGLFAGFALVLAVLGIYGVISYSVAQRTQEIGVRMALGASRLDVVSSVLKEAGGLAFAGVVAGAAAASALTPLLRSLLYGVNATDLKILIGCSAALVAVGLLSSLTPAARAGRVNPASCLRHE
jgi:predicted permease